MKKLLVLALSLFAAVSVSNAQVCALKSNALTLGVGAVNMGAEFSFAPQWTVDVSGTAVIFSPWKSVGKGLYLNGWDAVAEARYYLCKAFNGHHFGGFLEAARLGNGKAPVKMYGDGEYLSNIKVAGLGVSYGYYFKLNTFWGLDLTAGIGAGLGRHAASDNWTFLALPRLQAAFSYKF